MSYAEEADSFALVLGSPYRDGPGWVQAQDVLALNEADRLALPRDIHGFFAVVAGGKETIRHLQAFLYRKAALSLTGQSRQAW